MIFLILFLISVFVILCALGMGIIIVYHFGRFGIEGDPVAKRILNIFKIGGGIIIMSNIVLLILFYLNF